MLGLGVKELVGESIGLLDVFLDLPFGDTPGHVKSQAVVAVADGAEIEAAALQQVTMEEMLGLGVKELVGESIGLLDVFLDLPFGDTPGRFTGWRGRTIPNYIGELCPVQAPP
jgi:hypothetical protein